MSDQRESWIGQTQIIGPFSHSIVVVRGRRVPYLTAAEVDGVTWLTLDGRQILDLPIGDVERVILFIAECIAVASGYTHHPSAEQEPVPRPLFPRVIGLGDSDNPTEVPS